MTLLEALAALIVLGTTAVGFLEVFHTTARVTRDASDVAQVAAYAESVMEATKLDGEDASRLEAPRGMVGRVETRPWTAGVTEVVVVVTSARGQRLELRRLTRESHPGRRGPAGVPR